ncbi:helix-turn-helix transcriptional regulator [Actinomycetospora cinnamomea]|uniref:ArsR family transcriptional regulator n=1 Tax=Actinomycetospora cinnamomea TaxID=663609 RepID=A0A2U1F8C0_9PSEU|nr:helix-turn-helix domain-containing protein [Actinomycetospora cinnamomea]PVZ08414.1 ArsR family transcriptional regulator [Actinomycetospora cinnamomea]
MDDQPGTGDLHAAQASPSRRRLLRLLRESESAQDAHQLAASVGLHVTTVRFHLQVLEKAGLVRSRPQPRGSSGRPRTVYAPVGRSDAERSTSPYEQLARLLAAHLDETVAGRTARAERAGATWATQLLPAAGTSDASSATSVETATRHVHDVFEDLGFDPELTTTGDLRRIALRACPFRAVAREHPEVVCSMHLGLLRGALARLGTPPTTVELLPFVEPELCVAHLAPAG